MEKRFKVEMNPNHLIKISKGLQASFYSKKRVNFQLNAFIILWLTLALLWPKKGLAYYISFGNAPLTFLAVFVMALTIYSYLGLIFGHKEISSDGPWSGDNETNLRYKQRPHFILDHFAMPIIQILLLLFPLVPVLLISAGISGLSIQDSLKALCILFMTSLLCYIFGLSVYRVFEKRRFIGFLMTRSFLVCLLFASGFLGAYINPVLLIYGIYKGKEMPIGTSLSSYILYMAITILATAFLTIMNQVILRLHK